jgi:hypothetical protein
LAFVFCTHFFVPSSAAALRRCSQKLFVLQQSCQKKKLPSLASYVQKKTQPPFELMKLIFPLPIAQPQMELDQVPFSLAVMHRKLAPLH